MRHVVAATLILVAIIHLVPVSGVLGAERLAALYGIEFDETNLLLLMRHRALLFGVVGGLMLAAAFRIELRPVGFVVGIVSVVGFLVLAWSGGEVNDSIGRVVVADVVALVLLGVGLLAWWAERRRLGGET